MAETLLSVGLDVGTTSTQLVLSRLRIENRASAFAVPELEIAQREILYKSPVYFTPLKSEFLMDGGKIRELVLKEYARAGITREQVDTGAIIITGESSRKENAAAVLEALSDLAGSFVAAAAGPDLESVLAAKGAGADGYSRKTGRPVLHLDIGGGTTNLALIHDGEIAATGCMNVGGRLIKRDGNGNITYVSPVLEGLTDLQVGDTPEEARIETLAEALTQVLEMGVGLRSPDARLSRLTTAHTAPLPLGKPGESPVFSFSGGVADCMARQFPGNAFGDIGPALGRALKKSRLCRGDYRLEAEAIRATVIGAGCHSAMLSGSTVFRQNLPLPIKNIPVLPLEEAPEALPEDKVLYIPTLPAPGYAGLRQLADALARRSGKRLLLCLKPDAAKALGQALAVRLGKHTQLLCLDRVSLSPGSYLDVGAPLGPAFPVVVKTLIYK